MSARSLLLGLVLLHLTAALAEAQSDACATIRWDPAVGPVAGYELMVSVNGGPMVLHDTVVDNEQVVIDTAGFATGDALHFQVRAFAADGRRGPFSEASDVVFCERVPTPESFQVVDGAGLRPAEISWTPIEQVSHYVVFRSTHPSVLGALVAETSGSSYADEGGLLGVPYWYSVAAVASGQQMSEFTGPARATRLGSPPALSISPSQLVFVAQPGQTSGHQTVVLENTGDWELAYSAWPAVRWIQVVPSQSLLASGSQVFDIHYDLRGLSPGDYDAKVLLYTFFESVPGAENPPGAREEIDIRVTVPPGNVPPDIQVQPTTGLAEGQVRVVTVRVEDVNQDAVELALGESPGWVSLTPPVAGESGLTTQLVLEPGYDAAGSWPVTIVAWDDGSPIQVSQSTLIVNVSDTNRPPVLGQVSPVLVPAGDSVQIPLSATDPDGDGLAITSSSLPPFATLEDLGGGQAIVRVDPPPGTEGTWTVIYGAVDDGSPALFAGGYFQFVVSAP